MTDTQGRIVVYTRSPEQTAGVGRAVAQSCSAGDVVGLSGELGAGKTQFVRGLAEGLGMDPRQVSSPTFVIVQEYEPPDAGPGRLMLVHIDAYRIHCGEDLASIGWHDYGAELREQAVVAIEWAPLIRDALGGDVLWIELEHDTDGRRISLSSQGVWSDRMRGVAAALREAGIAPEPTAGD